MKDTDRDDEVTGAESDFVRSVNAAVGEVLRDTRESRLLTLPEFIRLMREWPIRLGSAQAQSNYESGTRPMPVATFLAECWALGVAPYAVMQAIAEKVDRERSGVMLDLDAMVDACVMTQLRDWASIKRGASSAGSTYWLSRVERGEMCALLGLPQTMLDPMLEPFTVVFSPR